MARIAALLLLAAALRAQSVDGTLTDSMTRAPIPDVIVTLLGPSRYNGTTDQTGAFHIDSVKPGKYVLNIVKAGYVLSAGLRGSVAIEKDTRLSVTMDPLGRVEGRVRYSDGRPAPRASVWLMGIPLGSNLSEKADDGGHFLFEDVKPGDYALRALPAAGDPKPDGEIWAVTWFPSALDKASAEPIRISFGVTETRDLRLRSVPARRLRGVVRDEGGQPAAGVSVTLPLDPRQQTVVTGDDGVFDFAVHDGEWRVTATRKEGAVELRGAAAVTVARHDIENATVRLLRPFPLPVIVDRDGPRGPGMVVLLPSDVGERSTPAQEGVAVVYPGKYTVQAFFPAPGEYVESVKLGDLDLTDKPVDIWDGSQPLRIAVRRGAGSIRAIVEGTEDAVVLVIGPNEKRQPFVARRNGSFEFGGLGPGDYSVLAVAHADPRTVSDPAFWRPLLGRAERVHLEKNAAAVVTLKPVR